MEDIGSLIFYVILAIIAIAGSVQSSSKKKKSQTGKTVQRKPATTVMSEHRPPVQPQPRPQYRPAEPIDEGYYEEPMASQFAGEGSQADTMAEAFATEGSVSRNRAAAFASEGSVSRNKAAAFAGEGVSSLDDLSRQQFVHTEISDSEIGDAPAYDYNASERDDLADGFDLRKAVIYSALLDRKDYKY